MKKFYMIALAFLVTFGFLEYDANAYPGGLLPHTDAATDNDETTGISTTTQNGSYREWILPKPANVTSIRYNIASGGGSLPRIELYDVSGARVWNQNVQKGTYTIEVDEKNILKVRVVNTNTGGWSVSIREIDLFGQFAIVSPYNLVAIPDTRSVILSWEYEPEPGFDHFDIYIDGVKKLEVGPLLRSIKITGLEPDKQIRIFMAAVYATGDESDPSDNVYVTPYGDELINSTKLFAVEYPDQIRLDWSETRYATYELYYNGQLLYKGSGRSYLHAGLELDTEYTYEIWIVDKYERKRKADQITVKTREPPEPEKPVVQIVKVEADRINVMWQLGLNPPFWVEVNGDVIRSDINTNQMILINLDPDTEYEIIVGYTDKWGREVESDPRTVKTRPPPDPVPITLRVQTVTDKTVRLTWTKVYDVVEVFRDGEKVGETASVFYVDEGLNPETDYIYRLRAVDRFGREVWSNEVTAKTNPEQGPPPLRELKIKLQIAYHNSARINWNDDFQSYTVYLDGQQVGTSTSNYYHFNGLTPSTQYTVKVVAVDQYGREVESNELAFTTTAEKGQVFPTPPGGGTPPPASDSGNPDLDKPNDHLVEGGNSIGRNAVILIGIIILILIIMFGSLWLMGIFKKKMSLTKSAKGKENNVLRRRVTTNHNQVQRMFQRTNPDPMKQLRRQSYRRRHKR